MKRQRRLSYAKRVGWKADFPIDVWNVIVPWIPISSFDPGFELIPQLLVLLGVCKGMVQAVIPAALALIYEELYRHYQFKLGPDKCHSGDTFLLNFMLKEALPFVNLERYLLFSLCDQRYHTTLHLSNALSLIHYMMLEIRYCRRLCHEDRKLISLCKLPKPLSRTSPLAETFYFCPKTRKALVLSRMKNIKVFEDPVHINLYERLAAILKKRLGLEGEELKTEVNRVYDIGLWRIFEIFEEHEVHLPESHRTFKSRNAKKGDQVENILLVQKDGQRVPIFSESMETFRDSCFTHAEPLVQYATMAYLLMKSHEKNWLTITKSDRFQIPREEKLQITCQHKTIDQSMLVEFARLI